MKKLSLIFVAASLALAQSPSPNRVMTLPDTTTHGTLNGIASTTVNDNYIFGSSGTTSITLPTNTGDGSTFTFVQGGTGSNCLTSNGYWMACGGGPSYETRKDDGKGPTLLQVKSTARILANAELPPTQYVALAKSVGIVGPVVERARILETIHSLNLHVYDWKRVDDYLYRQALRQGTNVRWVWKPVREEDQKSIANTSLQTRGGVGMVYAKLYAQPLPIRILKRMKEIECEMADVVFLVSDYEVVKPDPFLAITTKSLLESGKIWIIDQWDEPSFNDGPTLQADRL